MKKGRNLPFLGRTADGDKDYWNTTPETGMWGEDNRIGYSYAEALLSEVCTDELGMVLGHVAAAITAKGRFGGIEVGFFQRLGEVAGQGRDFLAQQMRAAA